MTSKDFIRKRDFYLSYVDFLIHDFPIASLYEVSVCGKNLNIRFFTFSEKINISYPGMTSVFVELVTDSKFFSLQSRFQSFIIACSFNQRSKLFEYYTQEHAVDFVSLNQFFDLTLSSFKISNK